MSAHDKPRTLKIWTTRPRPGRGAHDRAPEDAGPPSDPVGAAKR